MLKYVNYPSFITRPFHFSVASQFLGHSDRCFGLSISGSSFPDTNLFFDHCNRQFWYSIALWTIATITLNQQSIISTIAIDNLNHQSIISMITAIDIFNHQSINSTIAIDFLITSCELIPLLTDMASHKRLWKHVIHRLNGDHFSHFVLIVMMMKVMMGGVGGRDGCCWCRQ